MAVADPRMTFGAGGPTLAASSASTPSPCASCSASRRSAPPPVSSAAARGSLLGGRPRAASVSPTPSPSSATFSARCSPGSCSCRSSASAGRSPTCWRCRWWRAPRCSIAGGCPRNAVAASIAHPGRRGDARLRRHFPRATVLHGSIPTVAAARLPGDAEAAARRRRFDASHLAMITKMMAHLPLASSRFAANPRTRWSSALTMGTTLRLRAAHAELACDGRRAGPSTSSRWRPTFTPMPGSPLLRPLARIVVDGGRRSLERASGDLSM